MKFAEWRLKLHIYAWGKKSTDSRSVSALDEYFHIRVYLPHTSTSFPISSINRHLSENVGTPVGNAQLHWRSVQFGAKMVSSEVSSQDDQGDTRHEQQEKTERIRAVSC